jgi:hypothetical protein
MPWYWWLAIGIVLGIGASLAAFCWLIGHGMDPDPRDRRP